MRPYANTCCSRGDNLTLVRISDHTNDAGAADSVFRRHLGQRHSGEAIADERLAVNVEESAPETASLDLRAARRRQNGVISSLRSAIQTLARTPLCCL